MMKYPQSLVKDKGFVSMELTDKEVHEDKEIPKDLIAINRKMKSEISRDNEQMLDVEEIENILFR